MAVKLWPFGRPETRASDSYTDVVLAGLLAGATGSTTAKVSALAAVEACAGLWGRSFASAAVTPSSMATSALTPDILERLGRALLLRGEALFEIIVEDGELRLIQAANWDVSGRDRWMYRADFSTPSGTFSRTIPADRVLHPRIGTTSERPWAGESPLPSATAALAASLESKLTEEVRGPIGSVIPVPHTGSLAGLQADITQLKGKVELVETTAGGYGDAASAPKADWVPRRIGAAPPESLIELRREVSTGILAAAGCPGSLLQRADGTLAREEYRRFLHSTIAPIGRTIAVELADKLDTPDLAFDFMALFASDLSGKSRAFQSMTKAGMDITKAAALAGLMVDDDD